MGSRHDQTTWLLMWAILVSVGWMGRGCVRVEHVGGIVDSDSGSGSDSDDSARGEWFPLILSEAELPEMPLVSGSQNALGIEALWYVFSDEQSSVELVVSDYRTVCIQGAVGPSEDGNLYSYGGLGLALCYHQIEDDGWMLPMGECPFVEEMARRIRGVSFDLTGPFPDGGGFYLDVKEIEFQHDTPHRFVLEFPVRDQYLFADAEVSAPDPMNPDKVFAIQFHLGNDSGLQRDVDFCIRDLRLWVVP